MLSGVRSNNRVPFPCSQDFLWLCKMCRSNKENVNCLVFLTLFCINMRCWIKLVSDCVPSWRRVWTSQPHLCCRFLLLYFLFSAPPCTFSGPDRLCRLAPASQLFAWGGQSTGVSALASFLPKKSQGWSPSSYKDGHNKGEKWYGPNRRRRY